MFTSDRKHKSREVKRDLLDWSCIFVTIYANLEGTRDRAPAKVREVVGMAAGRACFCKFVKCRQWASLVSQVRTDL